MDISPAKSYELPEVYALEQAIEGEDAATMDTLVSRHRMFNDGFLLARKNGAILGYIQSCLWNLNRPEFNSQADFFTRHHRLDAKNLYIIFLGVAPDQRRKGVASALLYAIQIVAESYSVAGIQAVSRYDLIPMYKKNGFVEEDEIPGFLPGESNFSVMKFNTAISQLQRQQENSLPADFQFYGLP